MLLFCTILIFAIMLIGVPVGYSFLAGALLYMALSGSSMGAAALTAFNSLNSFSYLAIPLFVLAGSLMTNSGISDRLVNLASALLRKFKGGLAAAVVLASMFFGMLSGSNIATVTAIGGIMIPTMKKMGWEPRYIAAVLAVAGPLGFLIPPNTNAIMYAVISNASISDLFMASVIPGVLWGVGMMIVNRVIYKKYFHPELATDEYRERALNEGKLLPGENYWHTVGKTFLHSIPALIMPAIIFGGIYSGAFTATEAGAVAALYGLIIGVFIFRVMKGKLTWSTFTSTGVQMGVILFITPLSYVFTRILILNQVPQLIADFIISLSDHRAVLLLLIDLIFVLAGFFLPPTVIIYVITPLLLPTATAMGLDSIQTGVMLFVAIGIGNITPPMAMNLFIAAKVADAPVADLIRPTMPYFFFVGIPLMILVTFVPQLSTFLPNLLA